MEWKKLPGRAGSDRIFAIGDVHGQATVLEKTLNAIALVPDCGRHRRLIFTGDIIDRGPENLRSIELVMNAGKVARVDQVDFILGNHELMFLEAIEHPHWAMNLWTQNGGMALVDECDPEGEFERIDDVARMLSERLHAFADFARAGKNHLFIEDLLFVHAGVDPHVDIMAFLGQERFGATRMEDHWAWIREPFLSWRGGWTEHDDLTIIHGHTPHNANRMVDPSAASDYFDLVETNGRICLDAGAMSRGQLVLLEISDGMYRLQMQQVPEFNPNHDLQLG
ncbi:metallophosphoesterase [Pseudosulfitobacter pseudonitzschiae]|uniref:metallophosphoesterase n=1 Tax=Pseudosulfitobacter pseudonitzschiae TaxID=1402135 RepID=UPI003B7F0EE6